MLRSVFIISGSRRAKSLEPHRLVAHVDHPLGFVRAAEQPQGRSRPVEAGAAGAPARRALPAFAPWRSCFRLRRCGLCSRRCSKLRGVQVQRQVQRRTVALHASWHTCSVSVCYLAQTRSAASKNLGRGLAASICRCRLPVALCRHAGVVEVAGCHQLRHNP